MSTLGWIIGLGIVRHVFKSAAEKSRAEAAKEEKRKSTPCRFVDGFTESEFEQMAYRAARKIKRLSVTVEGPVVYGTVQSQSGISEWYFKADFNDYGHITGEYWISTDNDESNIPERFADSLAEKIMNYTDEDFEQPRKDIDRKNSDCDCSASQRRNSTQNSVKNKDLSHGIRLVKLTCSNCAAQLEVDLDSFQAYCPYCGQKLLIDAGQINEVLTEKERTKQSTAREEEETKRARAKEEEETKRAEMDHKYRERQNKRNHAFAYTIIILVCVIAVAIFYVLSSSAAKNKRIHAQNNEVKITFSSEEVEDENYLDVVKRFQSLGIKDIKLVEDDDLLFGIFSSDGDVEKVTINGDSTFTQGEWIPRDAEVVITYHTYFKSEDSE